MLPIYEMSESKTAVMEGSMITQERAQFILETYEHNFDLMNEWNDKLLEKEYSFDAWNQLMQKRSELIRGLYGENEQLMKELWAGLDEDWEEEDAAIYFEILHKLYMDAYDDFYVMKKLAEKLISYYEARKDTEKLLFLYQVMGFEYTEFYSRMVREATPQEGTAYFEKITAYEQEYSSISDPAVRKYFFNAYRNMIIQFTEIYQPQGDKVFALYESMHRLWNRQDVQALDGENEQIKMGMEQVAEEFLNVESVIDTCTPENREKLAQIVQKESLYDDGRKENVGGAFFRARLKCQLMNGSITEQEDFRLLGNYFLEELVEKDTTGENDAREMNKLTDYYNVAFDICQLLETSDELKEERDFFRQNIVPELVNVFQSVPYSYMTQDLNYLCAELFVIAEPFLNGMSEKEDFLFKMLICRQPITYIHSLMVSKISILIAQEVLQTCPEELLGACGIDSVEELMERQKEVISFIGHCGILHDVGKCGIAEVINQQRRRLSDEEFDIIKIHPQKGVSMLNNDEVFAPYYDVILGHHKFYDGKGGYPVEFDNTKSPIRGVIDLITIADCIDAATDILGRNYSAGKNFKNLLNELIKEKGTRYNPAIVDCIAANSVLCDKLSELTTKGRHMIYFQAYRTIKKLGTKDIVTDWNTIYSDILSTV